MGRKRFDDPQYHARAVKIYENDGEAAREAYRADRIWAHLESSLEPMVNGLALRFILTSGNKIIFTMQTRLSESDCKNAVSRLNMVNTKALTPGNTGMNTRAMLCLLRSLISHFLSLLFKRHVSEFVSHLNCPGLVRKREANQKDHQTPASQQERNCKAR